MTIGEAGAGLSARVARWIVAVGAAVVVLIVVVASARLGTLVETAWRTFPAAGGLRQLLAIAMYAAVAWAFVLLAARAPDRWLGRWGLLGPLAVLVAVRLMAIPLVPTPLPPNNDPQFLHELALGVLEGANPLIAPRPMGFSLMLAGLYAVFGVHLWLAEALNLACATVTGVALFHLVHGGWGARPASLAVTLYALVPSQILLATTIFTETAYAAFLTTALALGAAAIRTGRLPMFVVAGAALGVSQYVRPMSQAFLAAVVIGVLLAAGSVRRRLASAGLLVAAFVLVLVPVLAYNATVHGDLSLSTSAYGGWSVFVGANQSHNGMFNRDDQAILAELDGSVWERSRTLGDEGVRRILADPRGFANLAVRKVQVMWADESYAVGAALAGSSVGDPTRNALAVAAQLGYVLVLVATLGSLWHLRRGAPPIEAVMLVTVLLVVFGAHLVLEVQPRYHAYVVPLLCALAAPAVARSFGSMTSSSDPSPALAGRDQ